MKKYFVLILLLLIGMASYSVEYLGMRLPLPGATIADMKTQANTLGFVFSRVAREQKKCHKLSVVDTKVTEELSNVQYNQHKRKIGGNWNEEWTVNACGNEVVVPIYFQIRRNGVMSTIGTPQIPQR